MKLRSSLLGAYSLLLRLYPAPFRQRFAAEMLETAAAAEPGEWPLIFGDTSLSVVRCWIEGSPSTVTVAEPNAYLSLGAGAPLRGFALVHGLVLSIAIVVGFAYVSYRWPPPCPDKKQVITPIVSSSATPEENTRRQR